MSRFKQKININKKIEQNRGSFGGEGEVEI